MFTNFLINSFVRWLSKESCIKLYAGLLMLNGQAENRQDAIYIAKHSQRRDLRFLLKNLIAYGPN